MKTKDKTTKKNKKKKIDKIQSIEMDLYFSDLTPDAQKRFLKFEGLKSAAEGNYDMDILPITTVVREEEDITD
jgi:hypothetical protein